MYIKYNRAKSMIRDTNTSIISEKNPYLISKHSVKINAMDEKYSEIAKDRRKRTPITNNQLALLEETYKTNSALSSESKSQLGRKIKMDLRSIQIWFQNRRAKSKTVAKNTFALLVHREDKFKLHEPIQWMNDISRTSLTLSKLKIGKWSQMAECETDLFLACTSNEMVLLFGADSYRSPENHLKVTIPFSNIKRVYDSFELEDCVGVEFALIEAPSVYEAFESEKGKIIAQEFAKGRHIQIMANSMLLHGFLKTMRVENPRFMDLMSSVEKKLDEICAESKIGGSSQIVNDTGQVYEKNKDALNHEYPEEHLRIIRDFEKAIDIANNFYKSPELETLENKEVQDKHLKNKKR